MNIKIANRLIKLRKEKGFSQEALADALGISRQAVSKWERAESSPDTYNLICLAKLYGISLDELLKTDDDINTIKEEIHIVDNEDEVHISLNNIDIEREDELHLESNNTENIFFKIVNYSIPLICVIVYFLIGFFINAWHPGWVIFLFIPIWSSIIDVIHHKNPSEFAYPIFIVFLYILFSSIYRIWHPLWILFLTIPIYYQICNYIKK